MEQQWTIRLSAPQDAAALLDIYTPYITDTAVTFEYDVPTAEEFAARVREISAWYPYLVCERAGEIAGYAYAHRLRERAAYDWAAELSVYLARGMQGKGLGTMLYRCLIELLGLQHLHDVGWFEKRLGGAGAPEPVIAFPLLDEKKIQECLQRYTEMLNMEE